MWALLRLPRFTHPPPVEASRRPGVLPETVSMSGWDRGLRLVALLVARAPSTWPFGAVDSRTARMAGRRPCHAQLVTPTGGLQLPAAPRKTWWQRLVDWLAGAAVLHQRPAGTETLGPNDSRGADNCNSQRIYLCHTPADLGSRGQANTAAGSCRNWSANSPGRSSRKNSPPDSCSCSSEVKSRSNSAFMAILHPQGGCPETARKAVIAITIWVSDGLTGKRRRRVGCTQHGAA